MDGSFRVLVAGGGVAGLEGVLALHDLAGGRIALTLLSPERDFVFRPMTVVQPMVRGGAELLAGVVQDPVFGPLVAFGPGGILAEIIGDARIRIAPLTDADAEELVLGGKAGRLVRGFRADASDASALIDVVHRLSLLAEDLPEVAELDLNPVIGLRDGCVIVDARVRVMTRRGPSRSKTW